MHEMAHGTYFHLNHNEMGPLSVIHLNQLRLRQTKIAVILQTTFPNAFLVWNLCLFNSNFIETCSQGSN